MDMFFVLLLVVGLGCGTVDMAIMDAKGRSATLGLLIGLIFGPGGPVICVLLAPSIEVAAVRSVDRILREERNRDLQYGGERSRWPS